jgi:DNA-directed RNA polymerase specialized sigma24 family protein
MATVPARGLPDSAADLVRLAAGGHEPAFARIVRVHHADLVRAALLVTGDMSLATHAVVLAWPIAWSRLGRVGDPDRLGAWLAAIAVDEARRLQRTPWVRPTSQGAAAPEPAAPAPAETPADPELAAALSLLTRDDRALLALRFVAELQPKELSRAIGRFARDPHARLRALTGELAAAVGEPVQGTGDEDPAIGQRLRAYAAVAVRPVDADRAARVARAEIIDGRRHLVSVMVAAVLAVIVVGTLDVVSAGVAGNPRLPLTGVAPSPSASAPASPGGDGTPGIR